MAKRGDIFRSMPRPKVGKNMFNLSHDHKTTFNMGLLIPTLCEDALPGDTWYIQSENFVRAMALLAPVMERVDVKTEYFFVPNRLMWSSWDRWINGELINRPPYIKINGAEVERVSPGDLGDYLGYPAATSLSNLVDLEVSAFPISAYNFIWNEFYRAQNIQGAVAYELANDDNTTAMRPFVINGPARRNWQHDYFTSAQPWPAAAGTTTDIPISHAQEGLDIRDVSTGLIIGTDNDLQVEGDTGHMRTAGTTELYTDPRHEASVADLRRSVKIQEWLEKMLLGGSRLRELLYTFFGVDNQDMRLQVPELIGMHSQSLKISEVLSAAETLDSVDATVNPVGQMAGHGVSVGSSPRFKYFVREHGWIIGMMSVQPARSYSNQGVRRSFTRNDVYDYYWPQFANIGEQAILKQELYFDATASERVETWGYGPRYAEYRFINNRVSGDMSDTLDFWNFADSFSSVPPLDTLFLEASVRSDPFAIQDGTDNLAAQIYHNLQVVRPMPRFAIPRL